MRVFLVLELRRLLRDRVTLAFVTVMPVGFYLAFLAALPAGETATMGVRQATAVGLAAYGVATAASSVVGRAALERTQGWGRQLTLTPLGERGYLLAKVAVAAIVSTCPVVLVLAVAALTGTRFSPWAAATSALVLVGGSVLWGLYGLAVALAFRSPSSLALASAGIVLLAFAGEAFVPLPERVAWLARLTPAHGWVALARWPVVGGEAVVAGRGGTDPWIALVNVACWTLVMAAAARAALLRSRLRG